MQMTYTMFQLLMMFIKCLLLTIVCPTRGSLVCKEERCSCCRSGTCADPHQHVLPCQGCIDGYSGPSCYQPCPTSCVNCSQLFYEQESGRECYLCKTGYYSGRYKDIGSYPLQEDCSLPCIENCETCSSYYNCNSCKPQFFLANGTYCIKCPDNCLQCTSETDCLACEDGHVWDGKFCAACETGYFGKNCSAMCPDSCKNNQCHKSTGICIFCNDGYFMNQDKICLKCPEHCSDCLSNELCFSCTAGYMGDTCHDKCSSCKPGTECDMFTGNCLDSCKNGSSGEDCNLPCHSNCFLCERKNPYTCVSCAIDRYRLDMNCINQCSVNCINATCRDTDGKCILGCEHGYWGEKCEYNCSKDCIDRKCERNDGSCFKICNKTDNSGTYTCVCPTNCECDVNNSCARCLNTYGEQCDTPCSKGCANTTCDRKTGECLNGCMPGLSGSDCSIGPENEEKMKVSPGAVEYAVAGSLCFVTVLALSVYCILFRKRYLSFDICRICIQRSPELEENGLAGSETAEGKATRMLFLSTDSLMDEDQAVTG